MEIMNAEQYVVSRIYDLEHENKELQAKIEMLNHTINAVRSANDTVHKLYQELVLHIKDICTIEDSVSGDTKYLSFDNVYERFDTEAYKRLVSLLGLNPNEEQTDDEEEDEDE